MIGKDKVNGKDKRNGKDKVNKPVSYEKKVYWILTCSHQFAHCRRNTISINSLCVNGYKFSKVLEPFPFWTAAPREPMTYAPLHRGIFSYFFIIFLYHTGLQIKFKMSPSGIRLNTIISNW